MIETDYNLMMSHDILEEWKSQKAEFENFKHFLDRNETIEINFGVSKVPIGTTGNLEVYRFISLQGKDNLENITYLHSKTLTDNDLKLIAKRLISFLCLTNKRVFVGHSSIPFLFHTK